MSKNVRSEFNLKGRLAAQEDVRARIPFDQRNREQLAWLRRSRLRKVWDRLCGRRLAPWPAPKEDADATTEPEA